MKTAPRLNLQALRQAATTREFGASKKSWYQKPKDADRDLKLRSFPPC
jgi:hypothetical protein